MADTDPARIGALQKQLTEAQKELEKLTGKTEMSTETLGFRVRELEKQLTWRPSYFAVLFIVLLFTLLNALAMLTISPKHLRDALPWLHDTAPIERPAHPPLNQGDIHGSTPPLPPYGGHPPPRSDGMTPPPPPPGGPRGLERPHDGSYERSRPQPDATVLFDRLFDLMERAIELDQRNALPPEAPKNTN